MDRFGKGTGIVCEYNPFHKGHAYQIETVKKMGADFVVCVMSGDYVQRGEAAFQDKLVRAQNAVSNGADIVLELPFPFCSLSAEGFARSAISILENSGLCSSFAFGSECGEVSRLCEVAHVLDGDFHKRVIDMQKHEPCLAYAAARQRLVEQVLSKQHADIVASPNDILAVEYIKACKALTPIAIKRTTPRDSYDESFASSSYIREHLPRDDDNGIARGALAQGCSLDGIYKNTDALYNHMLVSLMQKTPEQLSDIAEVSAGSEYAIIKNAVKAQDFEQLSALLSSKTHTDAKIRRMLLFSFFGVTKSMANSLPLYTQVLAASQKGKKMLKKYECDRKIIVASRISEIKNDERAFMQYSFSRRAGEVAEKCRTLFA